MDFLTATKEVNNIVFFCIAGVAYVGTIFIITNLVSWWVNRRAEKRKEKEPAFKIDAEYLGLDTFSYHLMYLDTAGYYCTADITMERNIAEQWRDKFGCPLEI